MTLRGKLFIATVLVASSVGCGGGGSTSSGRSGAAGECSGTVQGAATGSFSECIATLNYYPDGGQLVDGRQSSLFSLVVGSGIGVTSSGVDSVGINFELGGAPAVGSHDQSQGGAATMGYVDTSARYFSELDSVALVLSQMESLGEDTTTGERAESFLVAGSIDFVISDTTGEQVTVSATF